MLLFQKGPMHFLIELRFLVPQGEFRWQKGVPHIVSGMFRLTEHAIAGLLSITRRELRLCNHPLSEIHFIYVYQNHVIWGFGVLGLNKEVENIHACELQ